MKKVILIYEFLMFLLVLISLFLAFSENLQAIWLDRSIWLLFVIDYTVRLTKAEGKWQYIKKHPFELIAIIPLDAIFRAARFVHIFRIIRLIGIGSRFFKPVYNLLKTSGLDKLLAVTAVLLFIIPIPVIMIEPEINNFPDALWWAIVTTTTVGYGDISPITPVGRALAVVLMLVGIGIIGTFTSAITSYFNREGAVSRDKQVLRIIHSIEETEYLSEEDVEMIQSYMQRKIGEAKVESPNADEL